MMIKPMPTTWLHLEPRPESLYRQLFVKGTRIRARTLYGLYMNADEPMTPEEIAADWDRAIMAARRLQDHAADLSVARELSRDTMSA